jgi:ubiquinone/menaquinone biosynthesis C-methylase UbiE
MVSNASSDPALRFFFDERASQVGPNPDWVELCFVSGKEPRLWTQPALYDDMMESIREQLDLLPHHTLLEIGCAAGLLAKGLAQRCGHYLGIDLAPRAVECARTLGLVNATFQVADGTSLPFRDGVFDRVICYDVFTNFPDFEPVRKVMSEGLRVTKPGGKFMVGSIPDQAREPEYVMRVREVNDSLQKQFGPAPSPTQRRPSWWRRAQHWWLRKVRGIEPLITCYYFRRADFEQFGAASGVRTCVRDVHELSPYIGYRFNVIYSKVGV